MLVLYRCTMATLREDEMEKSGEAEGKRILWFLIGFLVFGLVAYYTVLLVGQQTGQVCQAYNVVFALTGIEMMCIGIWFRMLFRRLKHLGVFQALSSLVVLIIGVLVFFESIFHLFECTP